MLTNVLPSYDVLTSPTKLLELSFFLLDNLIKKLLLLEIPNIGWKVIFSTLSKSILLVYGIYTITPDTSRLLKHAMFCQKDNSLMHDVKTNVRTTLYTITQL
jgi:hypothetical protein